MRLTYVRLGCVLVAAAATAVPAHAWQVSPEEHAKHHPGAQATPAPAPETKGMAGMKESGARLEALVAKMNAAQGQAKVDAIAELLTALVQQHQTMHGGMAGMMSKMKNGAGAK